VRRTSSRRVGRRIARWLLAAALGLELIWLVGVNALLCAHAIPHFVSAHTADVSLDYRRAWSFLPGDLHVRGFWLRGQPGGVEFYVTAEKVSAKVSLLALLRRTFRTDFIHAHGLTFRLRERLSPNQSMPKRRSFPSGHLSPASGPFHGCRSAPTKTRRGRAATPGRSISKACTPKSSARSGSAGLTSKGPARSMDG